MRFAATGPLFGFVPPQTEGFTGAPDGTLNVLNACVTSLAFNFQLQATLTRSHVSDTHSLEIRTFLHSFHEPSKNSTANSEGICAHAEMATGLSGASQEGNEEKVIEMGHPQGPQKLTR